LCSKCDAETASIYNQTVTETETHIDMKGMSLCVNKSCVRKRYNYFGTQTFSNIKRSGKITR